MTAFAITVIGILVILVIAPATVALNKCANALSVVARQLSDLNERIDRGIPTDVRF